MYFDSHAHLTDEALFPHLKELLSNAKAAKVDTVINICSTLSALERGLALAQDEGRGWIFNSAAIPPQDVEGAEDGAFSVIEHAACEGKLVAIGETGLDYYQGTSTKDLQRRHLERYFALADRCNLPAVIHCRSAFADLYAIADRAFKGNAIIHCFTGNVEEGLEAVRRGWMVSLSGIITFKKSDALRAAVEQMPLSHLLVETDAPYLAPVPYRGKRNEPAYIVETVKMLASIKGMSVGDMAQVLHQNAGRIFRLT